jgi:hypothetical protein
MTFAEFQAITHEDGLPGSLSPYLIALWHDHRGDWKTAHEIVQEISDKDAAWVHAYLHRKEGDEGNSRYWYRQAGKPFPSGQSLDDEWESLTKNFLTDEP